MRKFNVLVFPCGSEIGLEVHRSLCNSNHFHLIGASSVDDHGKYVFDDYVGGLPYMNDALFLQSLKSLISNKKIDAIYPAVDSAITFLKKNEKYLECLVIASCISTVEMCLSKRETYNKLCNIIPTPRVYNSIDEVAEYPVFGKFNIGHSAIGTMKLNDSQMLVDYISHNEDVVISEYLPGDEYTVDCFTDRYGHLLFYGPRVRSRIKNGISVNTKPFRDVDGEIKSLIELINSHVSFRGAWFAQFKRNSSGKLCLLEVAARLGGSSALHRAIGINFAQLTLFDAFDIDVSIVKNTFSVEMDRALDNVFNINVEFDEVFVDYDDCLLLNNNIVNADLVAFLFQSLNKGKKLTLITRHSGDVLDSLKSIRLIGLFDRIIQVDNTKHKSDYIDNTNSIYIDDSFAERKMVFQTLHIPVFGLDMIKHLNNMI